MPALNLNHVVFYVLVPVMFSNTCDAIKCFECNSVNNSACLDMNLRHMNSVVPVVDCASTLPEMMSKLFFCRKMIQTILHPEKSPEVRVLRSCGWVKHKRDCYKADNADHLETVCQCFGDMCNGATTASHQLTVTVTFLCGVATLIASWKR